MPKIDYTNLTTDIKMIILSAIILNYYSICYNRIISAMDSERRFYD